MDAKAHVGKMYKDIFCLSVVKAPPSTFQSTPQAWLSLTHIPILSYSSACI